MFLLGLRSVHAPETWIHLKTGAKILAEGKIPRTDPFSSGAAGAACFGPLHVGTDAGGSIRIPAAFCGLVGVKPSFGRIPLSTPYMGRCAGPMTRTVEDSALMMASMAQPDARDYSELPPGAIDWAAFAVEPDFIKGKRVGLLMEAGCGLPLDPQIAEAVRRAEQGRAGVAVLVRHGHFSFTPPPSGGRWWPNQASRRCHHSWRATVETVP